MSLWSFYFLAKVGLYYAGYLGFHWGANLLLALVVLWPVGMRRLRLARQALAVPLGVALLYFDSYLPSLSRVLSQTHVLASFSLQYLGELLGRVFSVRMVLAFGAVLALYVLLARRIRFATLALLGIVSVPLLPVLLEQAAPWQQRLGTARGLPAGAPAAAAAAPAGGQPVADPNARLASFYASEGQRKLAGSKADFDIIVLQVCSLSWDDMEFVGLRDHPLFNRFDAVFTQFNTAASYSGPAALRLARGTCGQASHQALYEGADASCYLFPSLEQLGWRARALLNHDGVFDNFGKMLETQGGMAGRFDSPEGAPIHMRSFDGSPIYADQALLSRWWQRRQQQGEQPVALYYNTVSLHDGNQIPGVKSVSSLQTYKPRLQQLLADFDRFITELESTGRPVVLVMVPEHGAALRGDKLQISGMREIPNPRITLVPAAVKVIGAPQAPATAGSAAPVRVDRPASYFDLNTLLVDLMQDSPFAPTGRPLAARLQQLQGTAFVAENDDLVMMEAGTGQYLMRTGKGPWVPYANEK